MQPVVGRDVEHPRAAIDELGHQGGGLGVRIGDRGEVAGGDDADVRRLEPALHAVLGRDVHEPLAGVAARGDRAELEAGVAVDEGGELGAGEAGRAEDVNGGHGPPQPRSRAPRSARASRTRATAASISSSVSVRPGSASDRRSARLTWPSSTCSPA